MAFADPQSVNLGAGAVSLPSVVGGGPNSQTYQSADATLRLLVSQAVGRDSISSMLRLDQTKIAADPISTVNKSLLGSFWVVGKFPLWGFSEAEKIALYTGLTGQLEASTNAVLKKLLALEK